MKDVPGCRAAGEAQHRAALAFERGVEVEARVEQAKATRMQQKRQSETRLKVSCCPAPCECESWGMHAKGRMLAIPPDPIHRWVQPSQEDRAHADANEKDAAKESKARNDQAGAGRRARAGEQRAALNALKASRLAVEGAKKEELQRAAARKQEDAAERYSESKAAMGRGQEIKAAQLEMKLQDAAQAKAGMQAEAAAAAAKLDKQRQVKMARAGEKRKDEIVRKREAAELSHG